MMVKEMATQLTVDDLYEGMIVGYDQDANARRTSDLVSVVVFKKDKNWFNEPAVTVMSEERDAEGDHWFRRLDADDLATKLFAIQGTDLHDRALIRDMEHTENLMSVYRDKPWVLPDGVAMREMTYCVEEATVTVVFGLAGEALVAND